MVEDALGLAFAAWQRALRDQVQDLREFAARVEAPALVLHGALDAVIPPAAGQWLAENLPKVERHVEWPDRGHCPLLTAPSLVAAELSAFL